MRNLIIILTLFLSPLISVGQLVTSAGGSPANLVQNVLLGSGVTVSNISFNGSPAMIGQFDGTGTNIGLPSGIIMTTGTIYDTGDGPHGPNNQGGSGVDNGLPGFSLLTNIAGNQTYDAAILEFDFVPYSDTVRFNYVFASEEYMEYVGSSFNDAFAFFISGPGIPGGIQNIARLPNGNQVTINNVNNGVNNAGPCQNCAYYNYNGTGSDAPYNSSTNYVQYDGFTKVLTAVSQVQCGQTYHLIIAIADTGDGILDSGIFLEANSLSSKTPVEITHSISQNLFNNPNIMAEGCVSTTVTLERGTNNLSTPLTIPINLSGTAIEGVDYTNIPNSITFPAGVQTVSFTFNAIQDGIAEGQESVILTFPIIDPCGNPSPLVLNLFINDVQPVGVTISGAPMECPGDPVILTATPTGGAAPYTYLWNTGETTQSITVQPGSTATFSVSVTDDCLNETATASYQVVVPVFDPLVLSTTPDITEICPYIPANISANPTGGSGNYTYQWSSQFSANLGNTNQITVTPSTTTLYTVVVSDNCGNSTTGTVLYTITSPPLLITMSPSVEICPGDSVQIGVSATGGFGQYFYLWPHSGETTSSVWVNPYETTTYEVIVSDECQTFTVEGTTEIVVIRPTANFTITSETVFNNVPIQFQNLSVDAISYQWEFGDGGQSTIVHPSNIYTDPGFYTITLIATDEKGCTDTISRPLEVEEEWYIYIPNTFTPDGDRFNNFFTASTYGIQTIAVSIFNRWGQLVFTSQDLNFKWDGTFDGQVVIDGTYTYKVAFTTNSRRNRTLVGHVNVLK